MLARILQLLGFSSKSTDDNGTIYGEEFIAFKKIFNNLSNQLTVIDIGANNGSWSQTLLKQQGHLIKELHLIEPNPFLRTENLISSKVDIKRYFFAISSLPSLGIHFSETAGSKYALTNGQKNYKFIEVKGIPGDKFVQDYSIVPSFIKIDTDGMDFEILKTFRNALQKYQPIVLFEFSKRFAKKAKYSLGDNIEFFEQLGYQIKVIDFRGELKKIRFHRFEVIGQQTKNFLAVPKS